MLFLDKLTKNLILEALEWDNKENLDKPVCERSDKHLQSLLKAIRSCGVTFNVWEKVHANGRSSGQYDFTSMMRSEKKLLLKMLPSQLENVAKQQTSATVVQIWRVSIKTVG